MALGSSSSSTAEPQDSNSNNQNNENSSNNRPILNPLPQSRDPPKPLTPHPLHHKNNSSTITTSNTSGYPSLQQPPPIYPVASSGRGFVRGNLRPPSGNDQTVTLANHGTVGYPPRSVVAFPHHIFRPLGFPHSDAGTHPVHLMRPPQYFGPVGGPVSAPSKGIPVLPHPKVGPPPSSVPESNGYRDLRDKSKDGTFVTIRDRKVRITDGASLYALCRSWLRNGVSEEIQPPQYGDSLKSLPSPLPMPLADDDSLATENEGDEGEDDEEEEGSVEHQEAQDLLRGHVKRAKRVRARLREERLRRIGRYKTRLALLLPPLAEQYRNDSSPTIDITPSSHV